MGLINDKQQYQDIEAWSKDIEKLKGYKELKDKVEYWAKQLDGYYDPIIQGSYEIVYDEELGWCADVDGSVSFVDVGITEIPFQFRNVSGSFICSSCTCLTSLKGCPIHVGDNFYCIGCYNLTSLEYRTEIIDGNFYFDGSGKKFKKCVRSLCNVKEKNFN